jgi:hypothetical protein
MIQKSRTRLFLVGVAMCASLSIAFLYKLFWAPGIILFITGIYLIVWATLGKGCWCRNCKSFGF